MRPASTMRELAITTWAVSGVGLFFVEAVARLGARTVRLLRGGLDTTGWVALVVVVALFCYGEGYRALQRRFVPHVIARAVAFGTTGSGCLPLLGAPLHAMSLVGASRRDLVRAWVGVGLIVMAIVVVRALPAPWRGIVDAGVTAALAWGLVALGRGLVRVLASARREARTGLERA
jgi:hypothetical protein